MIGDIVISSTWPGQQCHEITQRDVSVSCNHLAHTNKQTAQQQTICLQANKTSHTSASSQTTQRQGVYSAATPVRVDVNLQSAHCYDAGSVQCWMHLACWVSHIIRVSHWAFQQSLPCMWCCFPRSSTWANSPPVWIHLLWQEYQVCYRLSCVHDESRHDWICLVILLSMKHGWNIWATNTVACLTFLILSG